LHNFQRSHASDGNLNYVFTAEAQNNEDYKTLLAKSFAAVNADYMKIFAIWMNAMSKFCQNYCYPADYSCFCQ